MVIKLDLREFQRSQRRAIRELRKLGRSFPDIVAQALVQYGEFILAEATFRAPVDTGALAASGIVTDPVVIDDEIIVIVGFNKVYAAIQNEGGTIRPVRAMALFIPLRKGVVAGDTNLEFGVDFVLAQEAILIGNDYWNDAIDENLPDAARLIAERVTTFLKGLPQRRGR